MEDRLIEAFEGLHHPEVDGHEPGDGVINLILLAKNAAKLWEKIEPIVEDASDELEINAVAFRNLDLARVHRALAGRLRGRVRARVAVRAGCSTEGWICKLNVP